MKKGKDPLKLCGGGKMKCSICDGPIKVLPTGWSTGNNAAPVNDGRCCDECNFMIVIPARIAGMGAFRTPTTTEGAK